MDKYNNAIRHYYLDARTKLLKFLYIKDKHHNNIEGNEKIKELIKSGTPFSFIRNGFAEMDFLEEHEKHLKDDKYRYRGPMVPIIFKNNQEDAKRYLRYVLEAYQTADIIGNWYSSMAECKILKKYAPNAYYTQPRAAEPFFYDTPLTIALKGKRVLILSVFSETMQKQYQKRETLFQNPAICPEFDAHFLQSVWWSDILYDPRFSTWTEAFDYLMTEIRKTDFDIALLSCGSFGLPLCSEIRKMGKQSIYVGGALQLMFGIRGKRWDDQPFFHKYFNENWVYANGIHEVPFNKSKVENGCYW